jgi:hypothetical protein
MKEATCKKGKNHNQACEEETRMQGRLEKIANRIILPVPKLVKLSVVILPMTTIQISDKKQRGEGDDPGTTSPSERRTASSLPALQSSASPGCE